MAGLGAKDILRNITVLEQLIEEINFQRAKEMRQCLMSKDSDSNFVIVQGTTYWTDLFVRHFLFQMDRSTDADDLLFFIRKKHMKNSRYITKYQTDVEVYRKDSRKLPIGDPEIDWEETVYLNLVIHQFEYTLTLAICTRTSPKDLQVLKRHSQKVYASPSRRRMDTKGEVEEITYPNVCFHVDNFDEVFSDMEVRDGEMVCVELVAADHTGARQAVIFLGSIRYDALKRVYDARASLSSKVAQRMMFGLFYGSSTQRIEFVRMKGPQGKGHAEMAVTKPKGSGVETPSSEPGISLTDLWDCEWDDACEDGFLYKHQRRLSDPSSNFNTFINSGWKSRSDARSRSENEGLDYFSEGLYEIESGDVRDAICSGRCCALMACQTVEDEQELMVCIACKQFHTTNARTGIRKKQECKDDEFVLVSICGDHIVEKDMEHEASDPSVQELPQEGVNSSEPPGETDPFLCSDIPSLHCAKSPPVTSGVDVLTHSNSWQCMHRMGSRTTRSGPGSARPVSRPENNTLPRASTQTKYSDGEDSIVWTEPYHSSTENSTPEKKMKAPPDTQLKHRTVKLSKKSYTDGGKEKFTYSLPYKTFSNDLSVDYVCDMKLDDGAYNPLWTTKGFTQTFHFWKENRRQQSAPLNAYLTYVTLPWFTIITDILDHRTGPILTF